MEGRNTHIGFSMHIIHEFRCSQDVDKSFATEFTGLGNRLICSYKVDKTTGLSCILYKCSHNQTQSRKNVRLRMF